jgi:hypothetical protein
MLEPQGVFVILTLLGVAVVFWSMHLRYRRRELQHKERMAALEKGAELPALTDVERRAPWSPRVYVFRGMVWLFSGVAFMIFLFAISGRSSRPRSVEQKIDMAIRLRGMGATDGQIREAQNEPGRSDGLPWQSGLIGLVPIGVGLAYLIFYRLEGKNMAALVQKE